MPVLGQYARAREGCVGRHSSLCSEPFRVYLTLLRPPSSQVVELKQPMTPRMVAMQDAILAAMKACLDELRR
jgi:hypothetical protein